MAQETQMQKETAEGVIVAGVVSRVTSRTNEHGTFYTALVEWMGGRAFVELARDEHQKVGEGQFVMLSVGVRPYVNKGGGAGYSFSYGRVVG